MSSTSVLTTLTNEQQRPAIFFQSTSTLHAPGFQRGHRRRRSSMSSGPSTRPPSPDVDCLPPNHPLQSLSLEALDLPSTQLTPARALTGLRARVLAHLASLERRTQHLGGSELLARLRDEIVAHLPDGETFRSRLPDMSYLDYKFPDLPEVRSRLPDFEFPGLSFPDFRFPSMPETPSLSDLPSLVAHLNALHASLGLPDTVGLSEYFMEYVSEREDRFKRAIRSSMEGAQLICFHDLPEQWKNNKFIEYGYRFIPLERWPLIIMSLGMPHNEMLNIHTHLVPFFVLLFQSLPSPIELPHYTRLSDFFPTLPLEPIFPDTPTILYTIAVLLTLSCSAVWHTMAGCAHVESMQFSAQVDYVGIGCLIAVSVGTVVWYGLSCHPTAGLICLGACALAGVSGATLPFMKWFDDRRYKFYRIGFFVAISMLVIVLPLASVRLLRGSQAAWELADPVKASLGSYAMGFLFYASHVPERLFWSGNSGGKRWRVGKWLDSIGFTSHAIWHVWIVVAIWQHRAAMPVMQEEMQCKPVYWEHVLELLQPPRLFI